MDSATLAGQIADYDKNRVTSTDALNSALSTYGVPELRKSVKDWRTTLTNTKGALNAVDPSVTGRTSQSLVTEAQRSKMVNNERAPIAQQLTDQNDAYGLANGDLKDAMDQATVEATNKVNDWNTGRANLASQYDLVHGRETEQAKAKADAEAEARRRMESDRDFALKQTTSGGSGGEDVDPASEFLSYIGGQFKSSGGAGNKGITRQQQDAWANAWFNQNGVSKANRQQYWDLFNKTYNRTSDPTKDWRYAK
jgi:hypothetical protein